MAVTHQILRQQSAATWGLSTFVEGVKRTTTVVLTCLDQDPAAAVQLKIVLTKARKRVQLLQGKVENAIWFFRREHSPDLFQLTDQDEAISLVAVKEVDLLKAVNRGGGMARRKVYIPPFNVTAPAGSCHQMNSNKGNERHEHQIPAG